MSQGTVRYDIMYRGWCCLQVSALDVNESTGLKTLICNLSLNLNLQLHFYKCQYFNENLPKDSYLKTSKKD